VKQTAGQILIFEAKSAQYLASHEPKVLASLQRLIILLRLEALQSSTES